MNRLSPQTLRKPRQIQMSLPSLQITVVLSELRVTKTRYTWIRCRSTQEVKEDPGDRQQFLAAIIQVSHNALQTNRIARNLQITHRLC